MSVQTTTWAMAQRPSTPLEKLLLVLFADRADMEGFFAAPFDVAEFCCAPLCEVEHAIERLFEAGFCEVVEGRERLCAPLPGRTSRPTWEPSKTLRRRLIEAAGGKCVACESDDRLCIDHIIPRAKGGSNDESNLQVLCLRCNSSKRHKLNWKGRAQ